jgi:hypothetical protein
MLVKTRDDINRARGVKPTPAPSAPAPAPLPVPAVPDNSAQIVAMQQAITHMAEHMAALPQMLATLKPPARPSRLEAIPERDSKGRLSRIIVHVIE